jgi:hypothetical protein
MGSERSTPATAAEGHQTPPVPKAPSGARRGDANAKVRSGAAAAAREAASDHAAEQTQEQIMRNAPRKKHQLYNLLATVLCLQAVAVLFCRTPCTHTPPLLSPYKCSVTCNILSCKCAAQKQISGKKSFTFTSLLPNDTRTIRLTV